MIKRYTLFKEELNPSDKLTPGMMTNKGKVTSVDKDWNDKEGNPADILVKTDQGWFRKSEIELINDKPVDTIVDIKSNERDIKSEIDFPYTQKLDIRVCHVISAERVKGKDKLLLLDISTGVDQRTVVTNLGGTFEPEELVNNNYAFILNLKPAKIGGIVSNGMIIASEKGGQQYLIPMDDCPIGSIIL